MVDNRKTWTQHQMDRLWALAEDAKARGRRMRWKNVHAEIGHSYSSCQSKLQAMRDGHRDAARKNVAKVARPAPPLPQSLASIAKRPLAPLLPTHLNDAPYVRTTSTAKLVMDAELRGRIEVQGITRGLLGDPMPGRSALDRKRAGIVDAPSAAPRERFNQIAAPVTLATGPLR